MDGDQTSISAGEGTGIMLKLRGPAIIYAISATLAAASWADAKDEPHKRDHKGGAGRQSQPHQPSQGRVEAPKQPAASRKVDLPRIDQPKRVDLPRIERQVTAPQPVQRNPARIDPPKVEPRIQFTQNRQNNQPQPKQDQPKVEHKPNNPPRNNPPQIQLPQNNPPKIQLPQNPPRVDPPKHEPRMQLPQNNPNNPPKIQLPQNQPKIDLPKREPRQHQPQNNPNPNSPSNIPPGAGVGGAIPGGAGVQPKIIPQQPGNNPQQPGNNAGGNRLPQFNPNQNNPSNNNAKNLPNFDPKQQLGNGRGDFVPGRGSRDQFVPGAGNQKGDLKTDDAGRHFGRDHLPMRNDNPIAGAQKQAVPLHVPKNGTTLQLNHKNSIPVKNPDQLQALLQSRDHRDLQHKIEHFRQSPDAGRNPQLAHMKLDKISGVYQDRLRHEDSFQHWRHTNVGQQLNMDRQFQLQRHGDLTRQMNFSANVINAGGWQRRHHGAVAAAFTAGSFSVWYAGGGCYPTHCWYPRWSPWVSWCWWDTCLPFYDPRPAYCRPIVYQPCQPWVYYQYPTWQPLPVVACGTWVDVQPVTVVAGQDVQMLAVRFVDNGHPEQNLGPRYRVWIRNNSQIQITTPFSVLALASNDLTPTADLPQAGVVIPTMDIGEVKPIDIRLPLQANRLGQTPEGHRVPFNYLHILVDSHQQIGETDESNNGAVVARTEILPVDPAAFSTDLTAASPGATLTIAGEGFGPEPGRVLVSVNGQQTEALIQGWYDLGIRFTVPNYTLTGTVDADILVVRGDGAISNPLDLDLAPESMLGQALDYPDAPTPDVPQ